MSKFKKRHLYEFLKERFGDRELHRSHDHVRLIPKSPDVLEVVIYLPKRAGRHTCSVSHWRGGNESSEWIDLNVQRDSFWESLAMVVDRVIPEQEFTTEWPTLRRGWDPAGDASRYDPGFVSDADVSLALENLGPVDGSQPISAAMAAAFERGLRTLSRKADKQSV